MKEGLQRLWQKRWLRWVVGGFCIWALFLFWGWSSLALYFSNLPWERVRFFLSWMFFISYIPAIVLLRRRFWTALAAMFGLCLIIAVWFLLIPPSHDREWTTDVAVMPSAEVDGNLITFRNIRNFEYRSEQDFTPRYYDKTVDIRQLRSLDCALSYWDGNTDIAHMIISYGFSDGYHLAVSVETRREKGEPQTGLRGLFRQYELIYILGDERDLLRLRTDFRGEQVYLYPMKVEKGVLDAMFMETVSRINDVHAHPEFYDTLTQNCFTTVLHDFWKIRAPRSGFDIRRILNGRSAELAYETDSLLTELSFEETKKRCHINQYLKGPYAVEDYSRLIRHPLRK